jgi:sugar phosphate permease
MITPSVNVVQSAFPEDQQGEISGVSRAVSNLGSSLGTAVAGTILVSALAQGDRSYALAMVALGVAAIIGIAATLAIRNKDVGTGLATSEPEVTPSA